MVTIRDTISDDNMLAHIEEITGSESLCLAKWYNATIWLGSGMTTSCHHPRPHPIDKDAVLVNPKALHNTHQKKNDRAKMLAGDRPSGCEYCWKLEDINEPSDRIYKTKIYDERDLSGVTKLDTADDVDLKTLEISFDRTCNFACSYCNPAFSTTWVKDIKNNGQYTDLVTDGRGHYTHSHDSSQLYKFNDSNPYIEAFFKWWETDLHKTLIELRITGGEPLMSPDFWRLIEWFEKNDSNVKLAVNTNLCAKPELIDRLIAVSHRIHSLDIYTSNEAVGYRAEYIRDGLEWDMWEKNMHRLAKEAKLNGLHIMATPSVLSVTQITEFLDWCMDFKKTYGRDFAVFTLNILRFPSFQSITVLPDDVRLWSAKFLDGWMAAHEESPLLHQMEKDHVSRLANYLRNVKTPHEGASSRENLQRDLGNFVRQYSTRRELDAAKAMPDIAGWLSSL